MSLGNTNITTKLVAETIGAFSNDVGVLCACSESDINVPAFYISEYLANGGKLDGELIEGKRPKFNIWSYSSPAEFVIEGGFLKYQLKRNTYTATPEYIFSLGNFRNYDHAAEAPTLITTAEPIKVISSYINTTFRLYLKTLAAILRFKLNKSHLKFFVLIDNTHSYSSDFIAIPLVADETESVYVDYTKSYPGYGLITNNSGKIDVKIVFYSDIYGSNPLEFNQLLKEEIYGGNTEYKEFLYEDNYNGAWVKQAMFNGVYSDIFSTITGTVVAGPNTVLNGKILIPAGDRIDSCFVSINIVKKSGSYTTVSFDLILDGLYTLHIDRPLVNGTIEHEPETDNLISVDNAEHYYTINNITYS